MDNKKYNVVIYRTEFSESINKKIANLFKISTEKSRAILKKERFVIKKKTDKATAEKFYNAIIRTGANCQLEEASKENSIELNTEHTTELPKIEVIEHKNQAKPLTDISRPKIEPLHAEPLDLSLQVVATKQNPPPEEEIFANVNPENLCPECGTIRAGAESICLHCDFNPQKIKKNKFKVRLIKIAVFIFVIAVTFIMGQPFYQQYRQQMQIKEDLQLAFDIRNKITYFIQETNFWPNQNIDAGLDKQISNRSIQSISLSQQAVLTVIIRPEVLDGQQQSLIFTANTLKGRIVWNCLKGTLKRELRPNICQKRDMQN